MTEAVQKVIRADNSRESLIELKNSLRGEDVHLAWDDVDYLITLLKLGDPKSRKNVAQILGIAKAQKAADALYKALSEEEVEYVKSAYLVALKSINIDQLRGRLTELREELSKKPVTEDNKKHIDEQLSAYNDLLGYEVAKHKFTGSGLPSEVVLITQKGLSQFTADSLYSSTKKILSIGVCAKINSYDEVKHLRTYKELLFIVPGLKKTSSDPYEAAADFADGKLKEFLDKRHKEAAPWGYRVNLISHMDDKNKGIFIRRFAGELARLSGGYFVNSPSDYEVEFRLFENKDGKLTVLIKLLTLQDTRFDYRKEVIAASIRPELAATIIKLSADYLKSNIQVLDPFCGVGTMLIERAKYRNVFPIYGVDTFGEAITKARKNADAAGIGINFVNRNYFDFKSDSLFDEIVTNMPFATKESDNEKIIEIYRRFFEYSKKLLRRGAYVIIYARDINSARTYSKKYGYFLEKEVLISENEQSYLCIYRKK